MYRFLYRLYAILALIGLVLLNVQPLNAHEQAVTDNCDESALYCPVQLTNKLSTQLSTFKAPALQTPRPLVPVAKASIVTYDVTTRGTITADFAEFKTLAYQTLSDARGWAKLGVRFTQVDSGGQFTLVLAEASQLPSFSSGCSIDYSCNAGRYVIINQDRWMYATSSWNNANGSLRDYRHMVVNHETGHWLGHGHATCNGAGKPAAVMQQQSINLQGCTFNPWPLNSELWSTRLGIT